mmetsp:Transcript_4292/g.7828  ORF Transcript_4292/g.7828 Transcript_4292/m.7828 type:complete len:254 (-) Transcript_4292:478-1239(-)
MANQLPKLSQVFEETNLTKYVDTCEEKKIKIEHALKACSSDDGWSSFLNSIEMKPGHGARLKRYLNQFLETQKAEQEKKTNPKGEHKGYAINLTLGYYGSRPGARGTSVAVISPEVTLYFTFHPGYGGSFSCAGGFRLEQLEKSGYPQTRVPNMDMGWVPPMSVQHNFNFELNSEGKHKISVTNGSNNDQVFELKFESADLFDPKIPPAISLGYEFKNTEKVDIGETIECDAGDGYNNVHKLTLVSVEKIFKD